MHLKTLSYYLTFWRSFSTLQYNKRKYFTILFLLLFTTSGFSAKSYAASYDYEIVGIAIAKEGFYLVEITAYADKQKHANVDLARKCAIHGVLFKGFVLPSITQKPIMSSPAEEDDKKQYFSDLIETKYERYTTCSESVFISKFGKRYKIKTVIAVAKDMLRKDLEKDGVLRKLMF